MGCVDTVEYVKKFQVVVTCSRKYMVNISGLERYFGNLVDNQIQNKSEQ